MYLVDLFVHITFWITNSIFFQSFFRFYKEFNFQMPVSITLIDITKFGKQKKTKNHYFITGNIFRISLVQSYTVFYLRTDLMIKLLTSS